MQQKTPIDFMKKWLNSIFSITIEVVWTIFGSYDHQMIVYPIYVFYGQWQFCLVAMAILNLKKKKEWIFLNDISKTTVSNVAIFFTAYEESVKPRLNFLIRSEFFVSKGNLFDVLYIPAPVLFTYIKSWYC